MRCVESPDTTFLSDTFPVFWTRGSGCLVYDDDGNSFLDLTSSFGVLGVGHCHPAVQDALVTQSASLIHGMGDVHPSVIKVRLLEKISQHSPIPDPRIVLGTNGSDAVEAALKTALLATGKSGVLAFKGGYHGLTYGALEPTERPYFRDAFVSQRGRFVCHLPFGIDLGIIDDLLVNSEQPIGAVIVEPIQGRGGVQIPPDGWLRGLRAICSSRGVLLVLDEIFTGWGRTGAWFACEHDSIIPDLICIGKTMGGGMPISACIGSAQLMAAAWGQSQGEARHTFTFLGHPLSCAAALAAITVLEDEKLVKRSYTLGEHLLGKLKELVGRHTGLLREARGKGLMLGLEFHEPASVWPFVLACLQRGIIVLPAGDRGQIIEIVPPFIISSNQIDRSLSVLEEICSSA